MVRLFYYKGVPEFLATPQDVNPLRLTRLRTGFLAPLSFCLFFSQTPCRFYQPISPGVGAAPVFFFFCFCGKRPRQIFEVNNQKRPVSTMRNISIFLSYSLLIFLCTFPLESCKPEGVPSPHLGPRNGGFGVHGDLLEAGSDKTDN